MLPDPRIPRRVPWPDDDDIYEALRCHYSDPALCRYVIEWHNPDTGEASYLLCREPTNGARRRVADGICYRHGNRRVEWAPDDSAPAIRIG